MTLTTSDNKVTLFRCVCHHPDHEFEVMNFEEDEDLYFRLRLNPVRSLWKRVCVAIRFVWGAKEFWWSHEEVILGLEEVAVLATALHAHLVVSVLPPTNSNVA